MNNRWNRRKTLVLWLVTHSSFESVERAFEQIAGNL